MLLSMRFFTERDHYTHKYTMYNVHTVVDECYVAREERWPFMCYKVKWYTLRSIIHWVNLKWKHCT